MGTVTAITSMSLTVQFKNGNDTLLLHPSPAVLGTGPPTCPDETTTYQLSDVRVGDLVTVAYLPRNGRLVCLMITIYRRPGGKVPPLKADLADPVTGRPANDSPWHEKMQAYQDWEEKRIPIPDKYVPKRGFSPGVLSVPYPPVAPRPREVKPTSEP
jgi:hypothetical protein